MSLRIAHNVEAMNSHRMLGVSADRLAKSMQRLSSGLRINSAADDAAGLGISERMRSQIRGLERAGRNMHDGIAVLQTIDGALNEVHSILQRARDLATQWNGGTLGFSQKSAIRAEMIALSNEIGRIEETTSFNGRKLINSISTMTLHIGANDGETLVISLIDLMGASINNQVRPTTFFALPWITADVTGFDDAITDVAYARSRFGALQNRLEHAIMQNQQYVLDLTGAESRIRDVDFAQEMVHYTKQKILQQTGSTMLLFANNSQTRVLDLLSPRAGGDT